MIALQQFAHFVMRQRFDPMVVASGHGLIIDQRINDRFLHCLTVASKTGSSRSLGTVWTECVGFPGSAAPGLAVEKAINKSPEPLPETLPVRARPRLARRASRFS